MLSEEAAVTSRDSRERAGILQRISLFRALVDYFQHGGYTAWDLDFYNEFGHHTSSFMSVFSLAEPIQNRENVYV